MSTVEDVLYQAHKEGIKDEVFIESKKLRSEDPAWRYKEYSDLIGEAYRIVKERKNKEDENRH
jgi:predicted transcriptional regulator